MCARPVLLLAVFSSLFLQNIATAAPRRIEMSFKGQLFSAVAELKQLVEADVKLRGRRLEPLTFFGPNLKDSNFGLAFERDFRVAAKEMLTEDSDFKIKGEYYYLPGELEENQGLQVIQFVFKILDRNFRELHTVTREVNDTEDIARIVGATIAPPDTPDPDRRNQKVKEATENPSFNVREATRITATGQPNYAVEILRRAGGTGAPTAMVPEDTGGNAFVNLHQQDTFEIAVYNFDTHADAVAKVTIDGLDVANEFCEDKTTYTGYTVARASGTTPGRHAVPGWLRTATRTDDNVFRFVLNALGKGAATERKSQKSRGVITVQFFEAVPPGEELPSRSFGEVGTGEPMTVQYEVKQMTLRESPIATVTIRYHNLPE